MRSRFFIATACCALFSACFSLSKKPQAVRPQILGFTNVVDGPREPRLAGHIVMVNSDAKFVLIESDVWTAPPEGTALKCMRYGAETAILTISPERRGTYIVADIVKGSPQRGDEVFQ